MYNLIILLLFLAVNISFTQNQTIDFKLGADVFFEKYFYLIEGKRVGVICNQASVLKNGVHVVDSLLKRGVSIVALFSPEHGIRGDYQAGEKFSDTIDNHTGIKVYSLYGKTKKPTTAMLKDIDVLIFDLQDVGSRFYTYTITMFYAMQSAAENKKEFIVFDRPNPINGVNVEGPVLDMELKSGVGIFPIPIRHGMTIGEIAKMIRGEKWLGKNLKLSLKIIPMNKWQREKYYDELGLKWIPPSPNLRSVNSVVIYPGTCLIEATNVSEGRGTEQAFEIFGAPWINSDSLLFELKKLNLPGLEFEKVEFTPRSKINSSIKFKYDNQKCHGILLKITDRKIFEPVKTGLSIIFVLDKVYPELFKVDYDFLSKLVGKKITPEVVKSGDLFQKNADLFKVQKYKKTRGKYIIY